MGFTAHQHDIGHTAPKKSYETHVVMNMNCWSFSVAFMKSNYRLAIVGDRYE